MAFLRGPNGKLRPWVTTILLLSIIGGGFLVANIAQPQHFAGLEKCIGANANGYFNQCDEPINLTQCSPIHGQSCYVMMLEPGALVEHTNGSLTDPIKTEVYACRVPMVPTIVTDPNNRSLTQNGCRNPE